MPRLSLKASWNVVVTGADTGDRAEQLIPEHAALLFRSNMEAGAWMGLMFVLIRSQKAVAAAAASLSAPALLSSFALMAVCSSQLLCFLKSPFSSCVPGS